MKSQDKYLSDCFSKPMLTAYRRQPNLRNILIKSRIPPPPNPYPKRDLKDMKKCGLVCTACPYIKEEKILPYMEHSVENDEEIRLQLTVCRKDNCKQVCLGETKRLLNSRLAEHYGYVENKDYTASSGQHFSSPGHSLADLRITVIE